LTSNSNYFNLSHRKKQSDSCGLTKKAEPPPTNGVNRDSGTASANGGWLRRLVRPLAVFQSKPHKIKRRNDGSAFARCAKPARAKTIRTIGNLLIEMLLL